MKRFVWARTALLFAALTLTVATPGVHALELEDIQQQSHLGEPLHVLIPLGAAAGEHVDDLEVRLASPAVYERHGLEWPDFLGQTHADLIVHDGAAYVEIRGRDRVLNPIVELIVEVVTANHNTLRRQYSLLLDPLATQAAATPPSHNHSSSSRPAPTIDAPAVAVEPQNQKTVLVATPEPSHRAPHQKKVRSHPKPAQVPPAMPTAVPADNSPTPELSPPHLRMAETLEHPPFIAFDHQAAESPNSLQLIATSNVTAPTPSAQARALPASPLQLKDNPASTHGGWWWLLAVLLAGGIFAALKFRESRASQRPAPLPEEKPRTSGTQAIRGNAPGRNESAVGQAIQANDPKHFIPRPVASREAAYQIDEHHWGDESESEQSGFYNDVAQLLLSELKKAPERRDLRFKLLEVYYAASRKEDFREQTRYYLELLDGRADDYWPEIIRMGRQLLPDSSLYSDVPQVMSRTSIQTLQIPQSPKATAAKRHYETVDPAMLRTRQYDLESAWKLALHDPEFEARFRQILGEILNRPTPLMLIDAADHEHPAATLLCKYEAHSAEIEIPMINAIGQLLLAQRMGKPRVVTATIEGFHGLATATVAARLGLLCTVYMRDADHIRNAERVQQMRDLGADVIAVHPNAFSQNRDIRVTALEDWLNNADHTFYANSVDGGPYPYPNMVQHFQSIVGREAREQMASLGGLPDMIVVGNSLGMSAIGLLQHFLHEKKIALRCVENSSTPTLTWTRHNFTREHSWLRASGRVDYVQANIPESLQLIDEPHGFVLETAAAEVWVEARKIARDLGPGRKVLMMWPTGGAKEQPMDARLSVPIKTTARAKRKKAE